MDNIIFLFQTRYKNVLVQYNGSFKNIYIIFQSLCAQKRTKIYCS